MLAGNMVCGAVAYFRVSKQSSGSEVWRVRVTALFLASITWSIITAKVLSAQYVFWLFPLAVILPRRAGAAILLAYLSALAIGLLWCPNYWAAVVGLTEAGMLLVFFRNLLLLAIGVLAVFLAATYRVEADK
jgi:hypothetical protein